MFGELPKIFERDFVVGYVLPSALFLLLSLGFTHQGDLWDFLTTSDGASFAVMAFALGIFLLAINRSIIRTLEGYGRLNPARLMTWFYRRRFRRLEERLKAANKKYLEHTNNSEKIPEKLDLLRQHLMTKLVERYPHDKSLVLPTSFGNCIRAFESYPTVMYQLEIIESWTRLLAVIPKDFLKLIDTAKAETDLWINVWFLSLVTMADAALTWRFPGALLAGRKRPLVEKLLHKLVTFANAHGYLSSVTQRTAEIAPSFQSLLTILGALALAFFASWMAARAAIEWGSAFKAAVDVYLPTLYDQLKLPTAANWDEARDRWDAFSDAVSYRRVDLMRRARSHYPVKKHETGEAITKAAPAIQNPAPIKKCGPVAYLNGRTAYFLARIRAATSRLRRRVTVTRQSEQGSASIASTDDNNGIARRPMAREIPTNDGERPSSEKLGRGS
jgi:hypothetical protein